MSGGDNMEGETNDRKKNGTGLTSGHGLRNGQGLTTMDPPEDWTLTDDHNLEKPKRGSIWKR